MNRKKCWGIGLGRTGTRSLCEAFKILGFENVKHVPPFMSDLDDVDAAAEGICMSHYAYLDLRFPDSKFILTTRNIEPWLDSCQRAMKDFPKERITPESEFYNAMIRNRAARYGSLVFDRNKLIKKYYQHHFGTIKELKLQLLMILGLKKKGTEMRSFVPVWITRCTWGM